MEAVRDIVRQLPAKMEKVGVFVDERLDEMERVAEASGLTGIQYASEVPTFSRSAHWISKTTKYFVLRAKDLLDSPDRFASLAWYRDVKESIAAIFLDAVTETQPGGTGKTFDWKKAAADRPRPPARLPHRRRRRPYSRQMSLKPCVY